MARRRRQLISARRALPLPQPHKTSLPTVGLGQEAGEAEGGEGLGEVAVEVSNSASAAGSGVRRGWCCGQPQRFFLKLKKEFCGAWLSSAPQKAEYFCGARAGCSTEFKFLWREFCGAPSNLAGEPQKSNLVRHR